MECNNIRCAFGMHQYEIYKEEKLTNYKGDVIGKTIINRCKNCGKLKTYEIITVTNTY